MSIEKEFINQETGQIADEHKIEALDIDRPRSEIRAFVRSYKAGFTAPIDEDWHTMSFEEFEAAESTTAHDGEINKCLSKAYAVLDAKVFNPPAPEPE